ncbi:MAG: amino acid--tRNA ligase-related protein, partial [Acidobacteriaceae bacterium]
GTTITHFNEVEIDLGKWEKLTMREAIIKWWPEEAGSAPSQEDFRNLAAFGTAMHKLSDYYHGLIGGVISEENRHIWSSMSAFHDLETQAFRAIDEGVKMHGEHLPYWNAVLGRTIAGAFETLAEPHLIQPTIIYEFPLAVSPLSKQKPDEPDWVERFEFYIGGFELGNAFSELNDPEEQFRRFQEQLAQHARGDEEAHQMDLDYVRALAYGLPPTAGEGIGIDRLTMILTGARSIRDVILFPLLRPQSGGSESC